MELLILFIILNIANVVIQTVKTIATIKCGKTAAALVNAVAFGLYTIVLVYTNSDLNLWIKVAVVAGANLIGVYVVKFIEEKTVKTRLWKIEATFHKELTPTLDQVAVSHNYILVGSHVVFNFYCETPEESKIIKDLIKQYDGKYFASETKIL